MPGFGLFWAYFEGSGPKSGPFSAYFGDSGNGFGPFLAIWEILGLDLDQFWPILGVPSHLVPTWGILGLD